MSKKKPNVTALKNELEGASRFFAPAVPDVSEQQPTQTANQAVPQAITSSITHVRDNPREDPRVQPSTLPTRDEIQEFSFRLRDSLKVKVQAEVPHEWQDELEEVARQLKVKKLELYRFILGEFLGKVKRKNNP